VAKRELSKPAEANPVRAPDFEPKLMAFLQEERHQAESFFISQPWSVRADLPDYNSRLGCDILVQALDFLSRGRCRLLDIGGGEGRLIRTLKVELDMLDHADGSRLSDRFRGVNVNLTDFHTIEEYEEHLRKSKGIPKERNAVMWRGPQGPIRGSLRSALEHAKGFEEYKKTRFESDKSLARHGGHITGDIRDLLSVGGNHPRFEIVVSLGTLYYVPEQLEIVRDIYNNRLTENGRAYLEIGHINAIQIETPAGRRRTFAQMIAHIQKEKDYGIEVKEVAVDSEKALVVHMCKTQESIQMPLHLYDLVPRKDIPKKSSIGVIRKYKSEVEF
jgi:hypothetical protein